MALVEDLVSEGVALHVVTADAGLKAACSRCTNAVVYEDLDSLMASAGFREEGDFTYANVEVVAGLADELVPQVMGGLSRWLANVVTDEELPLRIMDAELSCRPSYVDTVFEVDVDEKGLGYFGHGEFIVPFQATVNMGVVYMLPRATYETLPPDMAAEITVVMEDRENYAATEERSAVVSGTLTFELDEALLKRVDASRGELRDAMLQARVRLDSAWVVEVLPQRN